jgi:FkbM family methyltransferase
MEQGPIYKEQIAEYLPSNPIIIEAGAHIGRDTIKMATLWPKATIYAFEPVRPLFEKLTENSKAYPNIHRYNLALSDHTGKETLYVSSGASSAVSSLLEPHEYAQQRPNVQFTPQQVETITLDEWAKLHKVSVVDFMWLDMQGAELRVLNAAPNVLKSVKALLFEVSLTERFKGNPLYDEAKSWMESHGFVIVRQDEPKHNKVNLLCVKKELI